MRYYIENSILILLSAFLLFLGLCFTIAITVFGSMGMDEILGNIGIRVTEYIPLVIFNTCNMGNALISSSIIWFIPFKNEKIRLVRQIITILIYICIVIAGYFILCGSFITI